MTSAVVEPTGGYPINYTTPEDLSTFEFEPQCSKQEPSSQPDTCMSCV
jgi:hypothetical protein